MVKSNSPKNYGNDSIPSLKGADRVCKRPTAIFGPDGLKGCEHVVFEILSNAIDKAREGHGSLITVTWYGDHSIEVEDFDRSCPVDWDKKEQKFNWELMFCELYAGGKYNNNDGDNYEYSLGSNGLDSCATQYANAYFDAVIHRDGFEYTFHFEEGENVGDLKKESYSGKKTGPRSRWKPGPGAFTDVNIPVEYYIDVLKRQMVVNAGVTFCFRNQVGRKPETTGFQYESDIEDYVKELTGGNSLTLPAFWWTERRGRDQADKPECKVKFSVSFCLSNTVQIIEHYHNSSWLEHGGSLEKVVKPVFVNGVDAYLKVQGKYQKSESKITRANVEDCLVLVSNNFSTQISYENQTKKAINNKFVQEAMAEFLWAQLEAYFTKSPLDAGKIAEQVLINKHSRENAECTRLNIKKKLLGSVDIANRVQRFADRRTEDTTRRELYIAEGDSALDSVKLSRDVEFQGIMPVRGKILNCLRADYAKIPKSEIITDLLKVLGCGVEMHDKHARDTAASDLMNLRWSKVVICVDADVDGFQIRTFIFTMPYRLTPALIQRGYVYVAESPLYEITYKDKTWLAYSDAEENGIVGGGLTGRKCSINRSKGLGENKPDMMWLTTMNPEIRRLIKVIPEDMERIAAVFDLLLGDNLQGRKDHIAENDYKYLELADIS